MLDKNRLMAQMALKGITQGELCKRIEMSEATFIRKKKTGIFNTDEILKIVKVLDIDEPTEIFLIKK